MFWNQPQQILRIIESSKGLSYRACFSNWRPAGCIGKDADADGICSEGHPGFLSAFLSFLISSLARAVLSCVADRFKLEVIAAASVQSQSQGLRFFFCIFYWFGPARILQSSLSRLEGWGILTDAGLVVQIQRSLVEVMQVSCLQGASYEELANSYSANILTQKNHCT